MSTAASARRAAALAEEITRMMDKHGITDEWFAAGRLTWNTQARRTAASYAGVSRATDAEWRAAEAILAAR